MFGAMQSDIMSCLIFVMHIFTIHAISCCCVEMLCACESVNCIWKKNCHHSHRAHRSTRYNHGWRTPIEICLYNECERDRLREKWASERGVSDWKKETVSCNFESPCLITTIFLLQQICVFCVLCVHIAHHTHIHKMQYAMHCNLVILHGRLFPINASRTQHFFLFFSSHSVFFAACHYVCLGILYIRI